MIDYHVILKDMPTTIPGFVRACGGHYTIVINARMSYARQRKTFRHEVEHIEHGDLFSQDPADQIEGARHAEN